MPQTPPKHSRKTSTKKKAPTKKAPTKKAPTKKAPTKKAAAKKAPVKSRSHASALESLFGHRLPDRVRSFFDTGEVEKYVGARVWDIPYYGSKESLPLSYAVKDLRVLHTMLTQEGGTIPPSRVPFAYSVNHGAHVAVDTTQPALPVWICDHESSYALHSNSFDEYLSRLLKPGDKTPIETLQAAKDRADTLRKQEKYAKAQALLEEAIGAFVPRRTPVVDPDTALGDAQNVLGICLDVQGDTARARATFEEAVRGGSDAAAVNLVGMLAATGEYDQVIAQGEVLEKELRWGDADALAGLRRHLGRAYIVKGNEPKATLMYHQLREVRREAPEWRARGANDLQEHQERNLPNAPLAARIAHWFSIPPRKVEETEGAQLQQWWGTVPKAIQKLMRSAAGVASASVSLEDLARIVAVEELRLSNCGLEDISFLRPFRRLKSLSLYSNALSDLSPLSALTALRNLDVGSNRVSSLLPLRGLTRLLSLTVANNRLTSFAGLEDMTELETLYAYGYANAIASVAELSGLSSLETLVLNGDPALEDVSPLANCRRLTTLEIDRCPKLKRGILALAELPFLEKVNRASFPLDDLKKFIHLRPGVLEEHDRQFDPTEPERQAARGWFDSLSSAPAPFRKKVLEALQDEAKDADETLEQPPSDVNLARGLSCDSLHFNELGLTSLQPVAPFVEATWLNLSGNPASDLSPLAGMKRLRTLYVRDMKLESLEPLSAVRTLEDLQCSGNRIASLKGVEAMRGLRYLAANGNTFRDLRPLQALTELRHLFVEGTDVDDLSPLRGLKRLRRLWIHSTRVTDLSPLADCEFLEELVCFSLPGLHGSGALTKLPWLHTLTSHRSLSDVELAAFRAARPDVDLD